MNTIKNIFSKNTWSIVFLFLIITGCERDLTDEAVFAEFPNNGDVFTDSFSAGLDYFPFVGEGADPEAFTVVTDEVYEGDAAMRFDVPSFGNGFVGATFNTTVKRDLSDFDALTFYAKASQAATINDIGFGIDGNTNDKYRTTLSGLEISTNWKKYIIPIPNASKLTAEAGLLWLGEGASFEGDEGGYVFWLDEVKFEKLGTIAQPDPAIFSGQDITQQSFTGSTLMVTGLSQTFNLPSGINRTVAAMPSYFDFSSSDTGVAIVDELGMISIVGEGNATITAMINGVEARGSIEITATGALAPAPVPTLPQINVKSIFSDAYDNVTESNFSPGFGGSSTSTSIVGSVEDAFLSYSNNNFTGIIFQNTVDASELTFMHIDVYVQEPGVTVGIQIRDIGPNQEIETNEFTGLPIGDDKDYRETLSGLTVGQWTSFEIPLAGDLSSQRNNLGAIILTDGPNFILDNIYFYQE